MGFALSPPLSPSGESMIRCIFLFCFGCTLWSQTQIKRSALGEPKKGPLGASAFHELAQRCVPDAPLPTLRSIAEIESGFNPLALSLNYPETAGRNLGIGEGAVVLARQPATIQEAMNWSRWFIAHGMTVSVGLMQVNIQHLPDVPVSLEQLFEPCLNLRIGWTIFQRKYVAASALLGRGQLAMHAALSAYNSGDLSTGFANGYVGSVLKAAGRFEPEAVIGPPMEAEPADAAPFSHAVAQPDPVPPTQAVPPPPGQAQGSQVTAKANTEAPPPPTPRTVQSKLLWDMKRASTLWLPLNSTERPSKE
jgi:type IV secretion system protein VirB1